MKRNLLAACVALAALLFAECANSRNVTMIPLADVVNPGASGRVVLIVEETANWPYQSEQDVMGALIHQVDLSKKHAIMDGLDPLYLYSIYGLRDGDIVDGAFAPGAPRTPYMIAGAPGPFDYALTDYTRQSRGFWEDKCYYKGALVYRLQPGVINYIPKELQPPLYAGLDSASETFKPDTTALKKILSRFPISGMAIVVPKLVAIISYSPPSGVSRLFGDRCVYGNDFTILKQVEPVN